MEPYTLEEVENLIEKVNERSDDEVVEDIVDFDRVYSIFDRRYIITGDEDIDANNDLQLYLGADLLGYQIGSPRAEKILMKLLDEEDELLVANAADSLFSSENMAVLDRLLELGKHGDTTIKRSYGLMVYQEVYENIYDMEDTETREALKEILEEVYENEPEADVKVLLAKDLFHLGDEDKVDYLLSELGNEDYFVHSNIIDYLPEMMTLENYKRIQEVVKEEYTTEPDKYIRKKMLAILLFDEKMLGEKSNENEITD